ncbi:MAG: heme-binding domain-containing protein [Acidobacteria bacterium]|nr:heme-binding domain-containing protein [Acidobacteriota bacterium]
MPLVPSPKKIVLVIAVLLVAAQAIRPARTNPPTDPSRTLAAVAQVPPDVKAILDRSCRDCHSHDTVWPWYSQVAPFSWVLVSHVNEGREHLALSDWAAYDRPRATKKLQEMCEQVRAGDMPMSSYVLLHRDAALSDADVQALCAWTEQARAALGP